MELVTTGSTTLPGKRFDCNKPSRTGNNNSPLLAGLAAAPSAAVHSLLLQLVLRRRREEAKAEPNLPGQARNIKAAHLTSAGKNG